MRLAVKIGLPTTDAGKSHSCVTPTSESSSPSAQTISVADGRSETMRGVFFINVLAVMVFNDGTEVGARAAPVSSKPPRRFPRAPAKRYNPGCQFKVQSSKLKADLKS